MMQQSLGVKVSEKPHSAVRKINRWLNADNFGILAAVLCGIHCLILPVMAVSVPALAHGSGFEDYTHYALAGFVVAFCLLAIVPGYRKHKQSSVLNTMLIGLTLVLFATFVAEPMLGEMWEMPIIMVGNLLVVLAHVRNRKYVCAVSCCG